MSNTETTAPPALTPAEWRTETAMIRDEETPQGYGFIQGGECFHIRTEERGVFLSSEKRHALAALCLHGQPFGFTQQDVQRLREKVDHAEADQENMALAEDEAQEAEAMSEAAWLRSLASRLAALLPRPT